MPASKSLSLTSGLLVASLLAHFSADAAPSSKRGFVCDGCSGVPNCPDAQLLNASWYYDYNLNVSSSWPGFVPMYFCQKDINNPIPAGVPTDILHGFNEPNHTPCIMSASELAQSYKFFMTEWAQKHGTKLVSPAMAGSVPQLYQDFFDACDSLYGKGNRCNVSYIAIHDYSCNVDEILGYAKGLYDTWGFPVILSEFSCGDGAQGRPTSDQVAFMKQVIPALDAAPYIFRYSWMSAHDSKGLRGLIETGSNGQHQLTQLGQLYVSL